MFYRRRNKPIDCFIDRSHFGDVINALLYWKTIDRWRVGGVDRRRTSSARRRTSCTRPSSAFVVSTSPPCRCSPSNCSPSFYWPSSRPSTSSSIAGSARSFVLRRGTPRDQRRDRVMDETGCRCGSWAARRRLWKFRVTLGRVFRCDALNRHCCQRCRRASPIDAARRVAPRPTTPRRPTAASGCRHSPFSSATSECI